MRRIFFGLVVALLEGASAFCTPGCTFAAQKSNKTCFGRQNSRPLFAEEAESETELSKGVSENKEADILSSPAFLKRKVEVLSSDIQQAEERIQAAKERLEAGKEEWGPQIAELELEQKNIQERMNALSEAGDDKAKVEVARAMLEVIDNYDRAFGNISPENDEQKEIEAKYKNTFDMIMKAFNELGIEEVPTVGSEFNYEVHNAVMMQPSEEYEEGIVIQEFQKGYVLGEECIRPASVIVAS